MIEKSLQVSAKVDVLAARQTLAHAIDGGVYITSAEKIQYLQRLVKLFPGDKSRTQCTRLRQALVCFTLTSFEAMRYLDIYYVPARILQLRRAGENILTSWATIRTEQGTMHRVGCYSLAK